MNKGPQPFGYYLSRREAAARLGIHPNTLTDWIKAGKVPVHQLPGGRYRFDPEELTELMESWRQSIRLDQSYPHE